MFRVTITELVKSDPYGDETLSLAERELIANNDEHLPRQKGIVRFEQHVDTVDIMAVAAALNPKPKRVRVRNKNTQGNPAVD